MIGLISCVKSKANKRCEAKDMYVSPLFKYMYAYAKKRCKEVYILSAKYGLLSENTPIAPYNVTLNSMSERQKKEWAKNIMLSLSKRYDLNKETFLIMGGAELCQIFKYPQHNTTFKRVKYGESITLA